MSGTASAAPNLDLEEQRVRIWRAIEETEKLSSESRKLSAEALKFERDRTLAPLAIVFSGMTAGAALFGAGIAFAKLLWP